MLPLSASDLFLGGFLAGLIIPHENGFAISLVEKLEDLVSLLFLPIVRLFPLPLIHSLILALVFHTFRSTNKSGTLRQRRDMGLHDHHLLGGLCVKVLRVCFCSVHHRFQLARGWSHRVSHEL